jgi:hypothetical protein
MLELNFEQCLEICGAAHSDAEACLVLGGAGLAVGSFGTPVGAAIGGIGGCIAGILIYRMVF